MRRFLRLSTMLALASLLLVGCRSAAAPPPQAAAEPSSARYDPAAVANFYKGQTITIIVGLAPGGGYDTVSRLLARHIGKYIPGNPNVVVDNILALLEGRRPPNCFNPEIYG